MSKSESDRLAAAPGIANRASRDLNDFAARIWPRLSLGLNRTAVHRSGQTEEPYSARRNTSLPNDSVGKSPQKDYASAHASVLHRSEVLTETTPGPARVDLGASKVFAKWGRMANIPLALQVVSSHLLGVRDITDALSSQPALTDRMLPHAVGEAEAVKSANLPRLFLLDGCSLAVPLGPLTGRLRRNSPGSKFLALLAPERSDLDEMIRLFYWGIDGVVVLDEDWKTELPAATLALLRNRVWAPREVLLAFVKHMKTLLDRQLLPGDSLTTRESQVLQLLFRRLTNKEIAGDLKISERTAKFHVCNVLNKLGLESRRSLAETFGLQAV
jgi:DNA-binding NarL/FixJ family response regulator